VILAKDDGNGVTSPTNRGPSSFPTPPSGGRPSRSVPGVNPYRVPPKVVNRGPGLGAGVNPAGAGNGGGAAEFDDYCPAPNKEKSQGSSTHHQDFTQKKKKRKKRNRNLNQHLNRQIEVNVETFEFEWYQIEKKAPSHGPDFGLDPDYGPDGKIIRDGKTGKPRAKQNKENYQKFTDNLSEFVKDPKSKRFESHFRKGRKNQQEVIGFINGKRFVIFDRHITKYITDWVMGDCQYQEFLDKNNIV
jgi:hypothetical protein